MSSKNPRLKSIEEQLAHLKWRKMQNERAVRAGLESTRAMIQKDAMLKVAVNREADRIARFTAAARDELSCPLILDDVEMNRIQEEEEIAKQKSYMRQIRHLEASCKIESILAQRLPKKKTNIPDRFSNDSVLVDNFSLDASSSVGANRPLCLMNGSNDSTSRNKTSIERIAHTKEKIRTVKSIKKHIRKQMEDIRDSKPIVTAKWQPALPT